MWITMIKTFFGLNYDVAPFKIEKIKRKALGPLTKCLLWMFIILFYILLGVDTLFMKSFQRHCLYCQQLDLPVPVRVWIDCKATLEGINNSFFIPLWKSGKPLWSNIFRKFVSSMKVIFGPRNWRSYVMKLAGQFINSAN